MFVILDSIAVFAFALSISEAIAIYINVTEKIKATNKKVELWRWDITRSVETIMIQASENGIKTFQPNFINWSYRRRGSVPRSQTKTKKKASTFTKNQTNVNQPPSHCSVKPSPGRAR